MNALRQLQQLHHAAVAAYKELTGESIDVPDVREPAPETKSYLSIVEAAHEFGVGVKTIRRRVASREWPSTRIGRQIRIPLAAITRSKRQR